MQYDVTWCEDCEYFGHADMGGRVPSADVVSSELFKVALDGIYERCQMLLGYWKLNT